MKATVESINPVKKKLHIQIPPDAIAREMTKAVADVAKRASVPGFRPGKAPKAIVERHYGAEIQSEVMNRLISDSYMQALQENNLNPVDMPNITNISPLEKDAPLNFTALVEVRPDISLGEYNGIEVKEAPLAATDEEVTMTIDRLRDMYASLEVVEGQALAKDHTAIIDFEGFRDGAPIEGAKAQGHMLELGGGSLIPGFEEQLVGMHLGETRRIKVTFPADYSSADLAGKDADFTVTLKEIKRKVKPELSDEFAKDLGEHKTVDELRTRIKEDIEIRKKNEQAAGQREELLAKLVENHSFDVPETLVEKELQSMARNHLMRLARQGADLKTAFDMPKFRERNRDMAVKRVKGSLILDTIAVKENLDATDAEVNAAMAALARKSGEKLDVVKKHFESQEGGVDNLRASLIEEKTLSLLLSRAKKV